MAYGAPRVIYNSKTAKKSTFTKSVVAPEVKKPIEDIVDEPEKVEDEKVEIPTTFVKKSGPKGDVNKYVKQEKE